MHKLLIRFKLVKNNKVIEAYLDNRLSFKENIEMLNSALDESIGDFYVYDPNKKVFLDRNIPLCNFNITSFMILYLFS